MDLEERIRKRLKAAGVQDSGSVVFRSADEFINACLGKVHPGKIHFEVPLEEIVSFWFNRCVNKSEAIHEIVFDIMDYFQEQFEGPLEVSELPELEAELTPKQLQLDL